MDKLLNFQIDQLKKLDFNFYQLLANGKEPLTYTYSDQPGKDTQVEVNAKLVKSSNAVLVRIDFDTNWEGRWKPTMNAVSYHLTSDGVWCESSFDGSEFAK